MLKASKYDRAEEVTALLKQGADIEAKTDWGATSLILASEHGKADEVVTILLSHGADVQAKDKEGNTSLIYASAYGREEVVKILLSHGANIQAKDNTLISLTNAIIKGEHHCSMLDNSVMMMQRSG